MVNTQHFKRLLALITIHSRILAEGETACLSYLSIQQWLAIVTYDLCFVPAVASVHISWLENQSVSYSVTQFSHFCNWSHKLTCLLLLFYSREEKNVALAELRDELLASKKSLESLRQEVSKTEKNSVYYQSLWSSAIYQWKGLRSCFVCCTSEPYSLPLPLYLYYFLTSQLSCHVTLAFYVK